jgi:hypothetical protein
MDILIDIVETLLIVSIVLKITAKKEIITKI